MCFSFVLDETVNYYSMNHREINDLIILFYESANSGLESQAGISLGTPNTKRCFRYPIECPTGAVGHSLDCRKHRLCSSRDMPNNPLELVWGI